MVDQYQIGQVQSRPAFTETRNVGTNAEMFGANQANAMQQVGKALGNMADVQMQRDEQMRQEMAQARAMEAENALSVQFRDYFRNPETGLLNKAGGDAIGSYSTAAEYTRKAIAEQRKALPDERSRLLFDERARSMEDRYISAQAGHEAAERKTYMQGAYDANIENTLADSAMRHPEDVRNELIATIAEQGQMLGWSAEETAMNQQKATTKLHIQQGDMLVNEGNLEGAKQYFEAVTGDMDEGKRQQAITIIKREEARLLKQQDRMVRRARSGISTLQSYTENGDFPDDATMQRVQADVMASGDNALIQEYNDTANLAPYMQSLNDMSLPEMQEQAAQTQINATEGGATEAEIIRRDKLQPILEKRIKMGQDDPISLFRQQGYLRSETLDSVDAYRQRVQDAIDTMQFNQTKFRFFDNNEAKEKSELIDKGDAATLMLEQNKIIEGAGQMTPMALDELSDPEGVFTQMTYLRYLAPNNPAIAQVASDALEGQQILRGGKMFKETPSEYQLTAQEFIGGAFESSPESVQRIQNAALAYHAKQQARKGSFEYDDENFTEALRMVISGTKEEGYGVVEMENGYNGDEYRLYLPQGMHVDDFNAVADVIDNDSALARSYGGGAPVDVKGRSLSASTLRNAVRYRAEDEKGLYSMHINGEALIDSKTGDTFILDMAKQVKQNVPE